jgi:transcription elongation factor Elf1
MTVQFTCPGCEDEVAFTVDEMEDELVCSACATRMAFAPDPLITYNLLYQAA